MINLIRAAWQEELRVPMFVGLSTDGYPLSDDPAMKNGARIYHMDTGKEWEYSADDNQWYQVPSASAVGSTEVTIGATPDSGAKIFIDTAAHFGDYLYNAGNEYPNITGGWELLNTVRDDISFSKETSYINFVRNGSSSYTSKIRIVTNKKIDLTNIDKLKFYASSTRTDRSAVDVYINLVKSDANMINLVHNTDFPTPIIADVSDYTGEYYVIYEFSAWMSSCESQLTVVELEYNADTPAETLKYLNNGEYVAMDYARRADIEAIKNYIDEQIDEIWAIGSD